MAGSDSGCRQFARELLSERVRVSETSLSIALHVAAGTILGVVGMELMPRALAAVNAWLIVAAFLAGGAAFALLDWAIEGWAGAEQSSAPTFQKDAWWVRTVVAAFGVVWLGEEEDYDRDRSAERRLGPAAPGGARP